MEENAPRGLKRKADQTDSDVHKPRRIKPLHEDVVNKIAAGEIIVAPVHALKELTENAVDAGSTSIEIVVKDGGLKLLQITDNGHGINRDDLPILCERFTTSKLKDFEDLTSIGTYGFRGEALASISHIAHLAVTTRTKDSSCAWRASYADGKLVPAKPGQPADPKPTAGRQGTQITVEDLFYNVPTRRRAFSSPSEEYAKILDMMGRYAVHCAGVSFTCKKHGESTMAISTSASASTIDRIRHIHGSAVANELVQLQVTDPRLGFSAEGWTSNANYHVKRTAVLLFINHRAVESTAIKKAIEQVYSVFLPKGGHPFIYISLDIDPKRVDVNIHPTKREVHFLHEDEVIERLCDEVRAQLANVDTSRTFMTQTLLPGIATPATPVRGEADTTGSAGRSTIRKKPYENNLIRTDAKMRKITSMLAANQPAPSEGLGSNVAQLPDGDYERNDRERIPCRLTSIKELRADVRDQVHNDLTEMIAGHTYIGVVDERRRIAAIQGGVKLYLVDYGMLCNEYFYQVGLTDFGNFGTIRLEPPMSLRSLLTLGAEHEKRETATSDSKDAMETDDDDGHDFDWAEAIRKVEEQLIERREMLEEYFALVITADGELRGLPLLMKGYTPSLAKLPSFLLRLGPYVNWLEEKECFRTFLVELAAFYVPGSLPPEPLLLSSSSAAGAGAGGTSDEQQHVSAEEEEEDPEVKAQRAQLKRTLEHILFPACRTRLLATKGLLKGVLEVANLKGLYRVFERC